MTEPARRRRRTTSASGVPLRFAEWFAGERELSVFVTHSHPNKLLIPEWWREWKKDNPAAKPPVGFERLEDAPKPLSEFQAGQLAAARAMHLKSLRSAKK